MRESLETNFLEQFADQLAKQEAAFKEALENRAAGAKKNPVKLPGIIIPLEKTGNAREDRASLLKKLTSTAKGFPVDFVSTDANTTAWGIVVKLRPSNAGDPKNPNNPGDFVKLQSFVETYNAEHYPSKDMPKEQKRRSFSDMTSVAPLVEQLEEKITEVLKQSQDKFISTSFDIATPAEPVFQALRHSRSSAGFVDKNSDSDKNSVGIMDFKRHKKDGVTTVTLGLASRASLEQLITPLEKVDGPMNTPLRQKLVEGLKKQAEGPLTALYKQLDNAATYGMYKSGIKFDIDFPAEEKGVRMLFEAFKHGRNASGFVPDINADTGVRNEKNVLDLVHNPDANTATITLRDVEEGLMQRDNKFRNGVTEHLTRSLTEQLTQQHAAYISSSEERARSVSPDTSFAANIRRTPPATTSRKSSLDPESLQRPITPSEVRHTPSPRDGQNNNNALEQQGQGRW